MWRTKRLSITLGKNQDDTTRRSRENAYSLISKLDKMAYLKWFFIVVCIKIVLSSVLQNEMISNDRFHVIGVSKNQEMSTGILE